MREVGTQQDVAVCEFAGDGLRFGRNDGVDAADLVAYFPTYFEQQIGGVFGIAHILMLICNFRDEPKKNSAAKVTLIFILNNREWMFIKIFNNNLTFQFHLVAVSGSVSKNVSITAAANVNGSVESQYKIKVSGLSFNHVFFAFHDINSFGQSIQSIRFAYPCFLPPR